jgi:hypothetical protein
VGVGHRRPLQEEFAHLLCRLPFFLVAFVLLAEPFPFGFLVEVLAHTRRESTNGKRCCDRGIPFLPLEKSRIVLVLRF